MIWKAPTSGNVYYKTSVQMLDGDLFEHEGEWYRVLNEKMYIDPEEGWYWYDVEVVA